MLKMIDVFPPNAYERLVFLGNLRVDVSCGDGNTYHFIGRIANIRKAFLGIRTSNWMVKELAIHSKADSKRVLARILTIGASVKN